MPPAGVEQYFRQVAAKENIKEAGFNQFLSKDDEGRRILFVFPQNLSEAVLATSLLKSAKKLTESQYLRLNRATVRRLLCSK